LRDRRGGFLCRERNCGQEHKKENACPGHGRASTHIRRIIPPCPSYRGILLTPLIPRGRASEGIVMPKPLPAGIAFLGLLLQYGATE
jgi:hypothetical protein